MCIYIYIRIYIYIFKHTQEINYCRDLIGLVSGMGVYMHVGFWGFFSLKEEMSV